MNKPFSPKAAKNPKPSRKRSVKAIRFEARLTPYARKIIKRAAEIQGRSMSDFVVAAAEEAAEKALRDMHIIELTLEDQHVFFEAMRKPPKPGPAWRKARAAHRRLIARSE